MLYVLYTECILIIAKWEIECTFGAPLIMFAFKSIMEVYFFMLLNFGSLTII